MLYVCVTKVSDVDKMSGYSGTTLIHSDEKFLVWLWENPNQQDLQTANVISMVKVNL